MPEEKELLDKIDQRFDEYKQFAFKGDMMKIAIAFIIGASFDKVIRSLVENIIMPGLNFFIAKTGVGWRDATWTPIQGMAFEVGPFSAAFVDFLLISIVLFIIWRGVSGKNRFINWLFSWRIRLERVETKE